MRDNRRKNDSGARKPGRKELPKEEARKGRGKTLELCRAACCWAERGEERPLRGSTRCKDAGESFLHILKLWGALPSAA